MITTLIETLKEAPFAATLIMFGVIQIVKIFVKRNQDNELWKKYREYVPYLAVLLGGIFSTILAAYYGFTNDDLQKLVQDAFYVGGGAVTLDQLLKPLEKRARSMFGLK